MPEQERIAEVLRAWDTATEKLRHLIRAKRERKRGLMQVLLTGKKRFKEFAGAEWPKRRLGELFSERRETGYPDLPLLSITRDNGVVPRDHLDRKDTSNADKSRYLRICPGDIGYNTMRMWQGVSALSTLEGIVSPAYTVCIPSRDVDGLFFSYLLKHSALVSTFERFSQGLTSDTWTLRFDAFSRIPVSVPSLPEQRKIGQVLATADAEIENLNKQLEAYELQKRGLMQQLLTGKKRVKAEDSKAVPA